MGLISGFMGGAGQAAARGGEMLLQGNIRKEIDEANALRSKATKTGLQMDRQKFLGEDTDKKIAADAEQAKLDRASRENVAGAKAADDNSTTNMKDAASLIKQGVPKELALDVAHGGLKVVKDEESGDMMLVGAISQKPVGRLTSGGTTDAKQWIPEGGKTENAPITKMHREKAKEMASEKAGFFSFDDTDFKETGGDRKEWIRGEAQRLANEEREMKTGGGGIVNSAANSTVDINRDTPQTAMPQPDMAAPKKIGKSPYPEGTELKGKDGKTYVVENGKPVLKTSQ